MLQISIDTLKCVACKLCELACSFHHKRVFDPEIASIEILQKGKERTVTGLVYLEQGNGNHIVCDSCKNEPEPLCVKYCDWNAVIVKENLKGLKK